jgi:hypothetical protein
MNKNAPMRDVTGRYLTKALFWELTDKDMAEKYPPLCTMKEAHDLYMAIGDLTEYKFAEALLYRDDTIFWDHWQRLLNTPLFMEYLTKWREELETRIRSTAIETMKGLALDNAAAAKWLAEQSWKSKRKAGRPSKQEIENTKRTMLEDKKTFDDDAARIELPTTTH